MVQSFVLLQGLLFSAALASGFPFFQKVPVEYINPRENPHPSCPTETHILGHGVASSPEEARKGARTDVTRQIRSSISALVERVSVAEQKGKKSTATTTLTNTIIEESDFPYAERIQDIGKIYRKKKNYLALSCLEKKSTSQHIFRLRKEDFKRFDAALENSHQSYLKKDRNKFTAEYPKIKKLYEDLSEDLLLIRTLDKNPKAESLFTKYNRLRIESDQLHSTLKIGVFSNHSLSQSKLHSIIVQNTITADISSEKCIQNQTHYLSLDVEPNCKKKMGNHFCSIEVHYSVLDCRQNKTFTQPLINSIVGADSRSQERALNQAYKQFDLDSYSNEIKNSLRVFTLNVR